MNNTTHRIITVSVILAPYFLWPVLLSILFGITPAAAYDLPALTIALLGWAGGFASLIVLQGLWALGAYTSQKS